MKIIVILLLTSYCFAKPFKVALGSCNEQRKVQKIWKYVDKQKPDLWIWLGDIIYGDHFLPSERVEAYNFIKNQPYYQKLISYSDVLGIWDDHDYGYDRADGDYKYKEESKKALFDFLGYDDPLLLSREGIYHQKYYETDAGPVQFIMLDGRSFHYKWKRQMLGKVQWEWLENTIKESRSDIIFISSGINVLSTFHLTLLGNEGWGGYRREKWRLYKLLRKYPNKQFVFLSGDRHFSQVSKKRLSKGNYAYEFMISGMTHNFPFGLPNFRKEAKAITDKNFATMTIDAKEIKLEIWNAREDKKLQEYSIDISRFSKK